MGWTLPHCNLQYTFYFKSVDSESMQYVPFYLPKIGAYYCFSWGSKEVGERQAGKIKFPQSCSFKGLEFWHSMYDEDHVLMSSVWQKVTVLKTAVNVMYILGQPLHLYMWKQWCDQAVHWLQNFNFYLHAYFTVQSLRLLSCQHKLNKCGKYITISSCFLRPSFTS